MTRWLVIAMTLGACTDSGKGEGGSAPDAAVHAMPDASSIDAAPPDAPIPQGTACANKVDGGALIYTCNYQWKSCTPGPDREVDCHIQAAGSLRFSLCDCKVGGVSQMQFTSTQICAQTTWGGVEMIANQQCGWDLK